jgi:hypothetical protein
LLVVIAYHPLWTAVSTLYEIHEWRNPHPILQMVHPQEWDDILETLANFRLAKSAIEMGGGNKTLGIATKLDGALKLKGWKEKQFITQITVDGYTYNSPTHKVDCYKNRVALEVEWNNKDPFFDRDLNNFRLLFELRVIDAGVIITRCDELQAIFNTLYKVKKNGQLEPAGKSYGNNTTHMAQLLPRVEGGGGGGCPIMVFGISKAVYDPTI